MNFIKPEVYEKLKSCSIAWFEKYNQFLIVDGMIEKIFQEFFESKINSFEDYSKTLSRKKKDDFIRIIKSTNLTDNNPEKTPNNKEKIKRVNSEVSSSYRVGNNILKIIYQTEKIKEVFEKPFKHLEINNSNNCDVSFDIKEGIKRLFLFKNDELKFECLKKEYHLLEAKLAEIFTSVYHKNENWLSSFHASSVRKNSKSILILGHSGSGKSTLTTLLCLHGFRFISDDLVLMNENQEIFDNPMATSLKESSWRPIINHYPKLNNIEAVKISKKGNRVKYLDFHGLQKNQNKHFEIKDLLWVNYSTNSKNLISPIDEKESLKRLIPETWIKNDIDSIKSWISWFRDCKSWEINYNNFDIALQKINQVV
jgi:hypothetical protein